MAGTGQIPHFLVLVSSLALCCGGAFAAYSEARSYFIGGTTSQERFAALAGAHQVTGLSIASTHLVLDNCYEAMTGVYGRLQAKAARDAVASTCLTQADATTGAMPSYSYAWYVGALAAFKRDDWAGLADRLRRSQLTGPNEQWVAELRVGLAEDNLDRLPDDVQSLNDKDLALLVTSNRGVASIADRYINDPAFRERITTIVEQLPQDEQQRFIANVDASARRTGKLL